MGADGLPQKPSAVVKRDAHGRVLPGSAAINPGGRPKLIREFHDWLREEAYPEAQKALLKCLRDDDGRVQMAAVKEVNDRLFGKAPQHVTVETEQPSGRVDLDKLTDEELKAYELLAAALKRVRESEEGT